MIVEAAAMGLAPSEFWNLSQPEIDLQLRGAQKRLADLYELGLFVAHHLAQWMRAKTLPEWSSVRSELRKTNDRKDTAKPGKQDWREVRGFMDALRSQTNKSQAKRKGKR